jgi:hypothetical protein
MWSRKKSQTVIHYVRASSVVCSKLNFQAKSVLRAMQIF